MMHISKTFHLEQFRHAHRAGHAALAQIIAQQIHDHQVFRAVLGVAAQVFGKQAVLLRITAARARALDRFGLYLAVLHADKTFRRGAQNPGLRQIQKGRVGRGA